jgi:competence protein CoiA
MRYALAGGQRIEAFADGRALCSVCNGEVIAKCGAHRVAHWAHRGMRDCDGWAETESDWHRAWKNHFSAECQEFIQHDGQSGEKHIADVRTPHGLVIEFQHSHLDPQERAERERFYGNMAWVVDGSRLQRDFPRFSGRTRDLRPTIIMGYFLLAFPDECFPAMWVNSSVPVIFDFRGVDEGGPPDQVRDTLWCLLPGRVGGSAVVVGMSREQFIEIAPSRPQLLPVRETLGLFRDQLRAASARETRQFSGMPGDRSPPWRSPRL